MVKFGSRVAAWCALAAALIVPAPASAQHGSSIDPSTFQRLTVPCLHLSTPVQPALIEPLRQVARRFCELRGSHSDWSLIGGGYRGPEQTLHQIIQRCFWHPDPCHGGDSWSLRLKERHLVVQDAHGNWVPGPEEIRNEHNEAALVRYFVTHGVTASDSVHGSGWAVDIGCSPPGWSFYVPCQLLVEQAFKESGFCRIPNEAWHYELVGHSLSRSCNASFTSGTAQPTFTRGDSATVLNYQRDCPNGRFSYDNHAQTHRCATASGPPRSPGTAPARTASAKKGATTAPAAKSPARATASKAAAKAPAKKAPATKAPPGKVAAKKAPAKKAPSKQPPPKPTETP
jgi:hypothetical protein